MEDRATRPLEERTTNGNSTLQTLMTLLVMAAAVLSLGACGDDTICPLGTSGSPCEWAAGAGTQPTIPSTDTASSDASAPADGADSDTVDLDIINEDSFLSDSSVDNNIDGTQLDTNTGDITDDIADTEDGNTTDTAMGDADNQTPGNDASPHGAGSDARMEAAPQRSAPELGRTTGTLLTA